MNPPEPVVPFLDLKAAYRELRSEMDAALCRVAASGRYIGGEEVEAFEAEWAAWLDVPHCVGVGNGLDALRLALAALDIGPGDEVIVPAYTFIATWLAVTHAGARPMPVDCDPATRNLDPVRLETAITPRTRAIVPVHLQGLPADLDPILAVARRHGLAVVEDAAQAHGARHGGRRIGGHGDLVAWSFYPGKNLGALGDAGAVTTRHAHLAERLRRLRNYGSRDKYLHEEAGFNSRLDPLQAAVLRVKLARLTEWNLRRAEVAAHYGRALAGLPGIVLPPERTDRVWHVYAIHHPRRDALRNWLARQGVETLIHYPLPPWRQGAYAGRDWPALPVAEAICATTLSLPLSPHLDAGRRQRVIDALAAFPGGVGETIEKKETDERTRAA